MHLEKILLWGGKMNWITLCSAHAVHGQTWGNLSRVSWPHKPINFHLSNMHVCLPFLITIWMVLVEIQQSKQQKGWAHKADASSFLFYKMQPIPVVLFLLLVCQFLPTVYPISFCDKKTVSANGVFSGRKNSSTIAVCNGGPWGEWRWTDMCPDRSYAIGFSIKVNICGLSHILFKDSRWFLRLQNVKCIFLLSAALGGGVWRTI